MILTNEQKLVENRDEALEEVRVETRGIEEIFGNEQIKGITLKEGVKIELDGLFVAIRYSI